MTTDRISELRADYNRIGHIVLDKDGTMYFKTNIQEQIKEKEVLESVVYAWNALPDLLDEVSRLAEDHARMTHTLRDIGSKAMDAMQGTARSQIAADWWDKDVEYG